MSDNRLPKTGDPSRDQPFDELRRINSTPSRVPATTVDDDDDWPGVRTRDGRRAQAGSGRPSAGMFWVGMVCIGLLLIAGGALANQWFQAVTRVPDPRVANTPGGLVAPATATPKPTAPAPTAPAPTAWAWPQGTEGWPMLPEGVTDATHNPVNGTLFYLSPRPYFFDGQRAGNNSALCRIRYPENNTILDDYVPCWRIGR